ncbi:hypothetical protein ACN28I_27785 [Archangium gephyra]|uniref:hypothetical protein n=1 Tax=Archangium gephyra TaxID=48 RepID=UPI003B7CD4D9
MKTTPSNFSRLQALAKRSAEQGHRRARSLEAVLAVDARQPCVVAAGGLSIGGTPGHFDEDAERT